MRALLTLALILTIALGAAGCNDGDSEARSADAETLLRSMVLAADDIGPGYSEAVSRFQTNEDAAKARPDSDAARRQYAGWGQVLTYNVQFSAPSTAELIFDSKIARVMNTVTLFDATGGAAQSLEAIRALPDVLVANFLANDAAGAKVTETQLTRDIEFAARGDESFAWRVSGEITFNTGLTTTFIADSVFLRVGRVTGNVTAVSLGQVPDRATLEALTDRLIERMRAADA